MVDPIYVFDLVNALDDSLEATFSPRLKLTSIYKRPAGPYCIYQAQ